MKLTWCGHSCFLLESRSGSVVFDPYAPGSVPGLVLPTLRADAVICSHEHADHFYPEGVELSGRKPDFEIRRFDCWHDYVKGAKRGKNMMTLVETDGLRVLHMGDLGHMLSPEQLAALGPSGRAADTGRRVLHHRRAAGGGACEKNRARGDGADALPRRRLRI